MISDRKTSGVFVKTPVLVQDTYSVEEIAILFRVSRNSVYEWHKREDDPLPPIATSSSSGASAMRSRDAGNDRHGGA